MTPAQASGITRRVLDADDIRLVREAVAEREAIKRKIAQLRKEFDELRTSRLAEKFEVSVTSIERAARGVYE